MTEAPPIVWALIAHIEQLGPNPPMPIAWAEAAGIWTIVLEDGRKIHFMKELDPQPQAVPDLPRSASKSKSIRVPRR
jgi:hypothetical protein